VFAFPKHIDLPLLEANSGQQTLYFPTNAHNVKT